MSILGVVFTLLAVAPALELQPGVARPGDAVLISVFGSFDAPQGQLGTAELAFLAWGEGSWVALSPLSVDQKPTRLQVEVVVVVGGQKQKLTGELEVTKANFRRRKLTVSKRFTSPSKKERLWSAEDQKAFTETFDRDFEAWQFTEDFSWPRNAPVSAPFGDLRLFNGKKPSQHSGADVDGDTGDPIFAANAGEVVMVRPCFGSGNTVLIHHGGRLFTAYFHLSEFEVKPGAFVKSGELLGKVGKTGRVTGPHLHFGAKLDGKWVDPESVLRLDFPQRGEKLSDQPTSAPASRGTP